MLSKISKPRLLVEVINVDYQIIFQKLFHVVSTESSCPTFLLWKVRKSSITFPEDDSLLSSWHNCGINWASASFLFVNFLLIQEVAVSKIICFFLSFGVVMEIVWPHWGKLNLPSEWNIIYLIVQGAQIHLWTRHIGIWLLSFSQLLRQTNHFICHRWDWDLSISAFLHTPISLLLRSPAFVSSILLRTASFVSAVKVLRLRLILGGILSSGFYLCNRGEVMLIRRPRLSQILMFCMRYNLMIRRVQFSQV